MENKIELPGDDIGMIPVVIGDVTITIDIYDVHNRMCEMRAEMANEPLGKLHESLAEVIAGLGFPKPSHRTMLAFEKQKDAIVAEFKKKDGLATDSAVELPSSTTAIPEAGPSPTLPDTMPKSADSVPSKTCETTGAI